MLIQYEGARWIIQDSGWELRMSDATSPRSLHRDLGYQSAVGRQKLLIQLACTCCVFFPFFCASTVNGNLVERCSLAGLPTWHVCCALTTSLMRRRMYLIDSVQTNPQTAACMHVGELAKVLCSEGGAAHMARMLRNQPRARV